MQLSSKKNYKSKALSVAELAHLYKVSSRTVKNWLTPHADAIGEKVGRFYTVKQVEIIFEKLGLPDIYDEVA